MIRELITFEFTDEYWKFVYSENSITKEKIFNDINLADQFNVESNFNLNLYGCEI